MPAAVIQPKRYPRAVTGSPNRAPESAPGRWAWRTHRFSAGATTSRRRPRRRTPSGRARPRSRDGQWRDHRQAASGEQRGHDPGRHRIRCDQVRGADQRRCRRRKPHEDLGTWASYGQARRPSHETFRRTPRRMLDAHLKSTGRGRRADRSGRRRRSERRGFRSWPLRTAGARPRQPVTVRRRGRPVCCGGLCRQRDAPSEVDQAADRGRATFRPTVLGLIGRDAVLDAVAAVADEGKPPDWTASS